MDPKSIEKDPKTQVQELLQSQGDLPPSYDVVTMSGQPHEREFTVQCRIESRKLITEGQGSSRKAAEQQAAFAALIAIREG